MASEQDNIDVDPVYKQGFETGYWLQRDNRRELDQAIESSRANPTYSNGLRAGRQQAYREASRTRREQTKGRQDPNKDKGPEIG